MKLIKCKRYKNRNVEKTTVWAILINESLEVWFNFNQLDSELLLADSELNGLADS